MAVGGHREGKRDEGTVAPSAMARAPLGVMRGGGREDEGGHPPAGPPPDRFVVAAAWAPPRHRTPRRECCAPLPDSVAVTFLVRHGGPPPPHHAPERPDHGLTVEGWYGGLIWGVAVMVMADRSSNKCREPLAQMAPPLREQRQHLLLF